jgi:hypothetical protein
MHLGSSTSANRSLHNYCLTAEISESIPVAAAIQGPQNADWPGLRRLVLAYIPGYAGFSQILALANGDEKNARCYARTAFAFGTTAQNPRPNHQKAA